MSGLIQSLEAAEGGARTLDYAIKAWLEVHDKYWDNRVPADWTTSLDAALALAERVLGEDEALRLLARIVADVYDDPVNGTIKDLPRLLCIAILRAKEGGQ